MNHQSFDVFDTCLSRVFASPQDLFFELARRSLREAGHDAAPEDIADIARIRIESEARARRATDRQDIGLAQIYEQAAVLKRWGIDPAAMGEAEIELEKKSMRPVGAVLKLVREARRKGDVVLFISDMYLPGKVVGDMLTAHGFLQDGDRLYVSGDIGLTKRSGALFTHVLKDLNLKPGRLLHRGDHPRSDYRIPRSLGIRAELRQPAALNRYEVLLAGGRRDHQSATTPAALAGISRCLRIAPPRSADALSERSIFANIAGPMIIAYIAWVLRDAHRNGINRLYFVSRDGWIFLHAAKALKKHMPGPRCEYLYGSRQAWFAAVADSMSDVLLMDDQSRVIAHVLRRFNVAEAEFTGIAKGRFRDYQRPLNDEEWRDFLDFLGSDAMQGLIRAAAADSMDRAKRYLTENGLTDEVEWAMVDIGWTLKTQRALGEILKRAGRSRPVRAYYLGISAERRLDPFPGIYRAFYVQPEAGGAQFGLDRIFPWMWMLENVFTMASHGSVSGYAESGERMVPVFRKIDHEQARSRTLDEHQTLLDMLAEEYARAGLLTEDRLDETISVLRQYASEGFMKMMLEPTAAEAGAYAWVPVGDDQNEASQSPVARRLNPLDFFKYVVSVLRGRPRNQIEQGFVWLRGSEALSGPFTRWLFRVTRSLRRLGKRR